MEVFENETFSPPPGDVEFLRQRMGGRFEQRHGGWAITRLVGHLWLPSGEVLRIRSAKSPDAAVIAWAAYCDPALASLGHIHEIPEAAEEGDVGGLVARLFTRELRRAFARHGALRAYRRVRRDSSDVRGRIDFAALAKRGGDLSRLPCRIWERLPNTRVNRLFAAAYRWVLRDPMLRVAAGPDLMALAAVLEGIEPAVDAELLRGRAALDRTEEPFALALALARLLLQRASLGAGSEQAGLGFLLNVEALFERTVVRALELAGLDVVAKHPIRYHHVRGESRSIQTLQLDAFCPRTPVGPLVVDAKYKSAISAANVQQMVTYCVATGASQAVLVMPEPEPAARYEVKVAPPWGGSAGRRPILIHRIGMQTGGRSVAAWRRAGEELARAIAALVTPGAVWATSSPST